MKGEEIRIFAGKYAGKKAWKNDQGDHDDRVTQVIVDLGKGRGEKYTYIYNTSYEVSKAPKTYAEACMTQCPDIEKNLVAVTRQLAKCDIRRDEEGFKEVIHKKMADAIKWQEKKGSKAVYRRINYP